MRLLITIPHYFGPGPANSPNRSNRPQARAQRLQALAAVITSLHQNFGRESYGLDHEHGRAVRAEYLEGHALEIVVLTTGAHHLLDELSQIKPLFRHHETDADAMLLGFECHKLLGKYPEQYDYFGYLEDDVLVSDASFFRKRRAFDRRFGPGALLQPHRYEIAVNEHVRKLYVDYRLAKRVTSDWQNVGEASQLELSFCDELIRMERATYPSAGCFFLNPVQLQYWIRSPHFLDADVSYLSALDSASILSVAKSFRVYKPCLEQAWFLEVLHASPRWVRGLRDE